MWLVSVLGGSLVGLPACLLAWALYGSLVGLPGRLWEPSRLAWVAHFFAAWLTPSWAGQACHHATPGCPCSCMQPPAVTITSAQSIQSIVTLVNPSGFNKCARGWGRGMLHAVSAKHLTALCSLHLFATLPGSALQIVWSCIDVPKSSLLLRRLWVWSLVYGGAELLLSQAGAAPHSSAALWVAPWHGARVSDSHPL